MNNAPTLKVSDNFDKKLNTKIKALNGKKEVNKGFFGFSTQNFVYLTLSLMCIFIFSAYLIQPSDSSYLIVDEEISTDQINSDEDTVPEIKDVDLLNDVNGSFVSDKE